MLEEVEQQTDTTLLYVAAVFFGPIGIAYHQLRKVLSSWAPIPRQIAAHLLYLTSIVILIAFIELRGTGKNCLLTVIFQLLVFD